MPGRRRSVPSSPSAAAGARPALQAAGPPPPPGRDQVEAFEALARQAPAAVRASAQAWRTGLSGMITLVAAGAVISGRTTASDVSTGWRVAVTTAVGASLALAVRGLWLALTVEVGGRRIRTLTLQDILDEGYATVAAFQLAEAKRAGEDLQRARNVAAAALVLLLTGVLLTWWAPAAPKDPPAFVVVTSTTEPRGPGPDGMSVCGVLQSADGGQLRLKVNGSHDPVVVPLRDLANVAVVATCPTR